MAVLYYESQLAHHGIKGQKWGVRRFQNYNGTRTAAGKKRYSESGPRQLSTLSKTAYARSVASQVALAAASSVASKYFPLPVAIAIGGSVAIHRGRRAYTATADFVKKDGDYEKLSDMVKHDEEPSYISVYKVNKKPSLGSGREVNCASCSIAMDMRSRGYDVRARRQNDGMLSYDILKNYKNAKVESIPSPIKKGAQASYENVYNTLKGKGSGILTMDWKGLGSSGHAIFYKSDKNGVEFYDGQSGTFGSDIDAYFSLAKPSQFQYIRTDNCALTDEVTKAVVSVVRKDK